jgi:ubiquinone/menaquinone biosynthesis C-methylase UbiE
MSTAVERFLTDFHDRQPGGSSRAFASLWVTDETGEPHASPYHALADRVQAADTTLPPGPLLDLACGDGHLLALLAGSGRPLLGVDSSAGELAAALSRLGAAVPLLQARAQALPLAEGSAAVITCHMALMLMAEPEAVVAELRRVLQPGGRLLAVLPATPVPADALPDTLTAAFLAALAGQARLADWQAVRFEGRRWRDPGSLQSLLQPAFSALRCTRLTGTQALTPDAAWTWFTGLYDLHLLPPAAWPAVEAEFRRRLPPLLDERGLAALPHSFFLIDATAAS